MKRLLLAALLILVAPFVYAQQLINCQNNPSPIPCTTAGPLMTSNGDAAYVSFGKDNANWLILQSAGLFSGNINFTSGTFGATTPIGGNLGNGTLNVSAGYYVNGVIVPNYPRTAAEIAAGVTPVNYGYPSCNVNRYEVNTTPGTTDMSAGFANAISACSIAGSPNSVYVPSGTYLAAFTMPSSTNFVLYGDGGSSDIVQKSTGTTISWSTASEIFSEQTIRDLAFTTTAGTANTINTAGAGGLSLQNLYFTDTPAAADDIFINGAASTATHDTRLINIRIYYSSVTTGNAGVEFGSLSADSSITRLIMNGGLHTLYGIYLDSGAITTVMSDSHPYNLATNIVYAAGSNNDMQFTHDIFDHAVSGDLVSINGSSDIVFSADYFEAAQSGKNGVTLANSTGVSFYSDMWQGVSGAGYTLNETGTSNYNRIDGGNFNALANWNASVYHLVGSNSQVCNVAGVANSLGCISSSTTTVSSLPTCNSAIKGWQYIVTDATSPTYNGSLTGGGSTVVPVFCSGTSWTAH